MDNPTSPTPPEPQSDSQTPSMEKVSEKTKKEIPVVSVLHDDDMIAEEMADLFEEDQVTHKHGSSEPEGD